MANKIQPTLIVGIVVGVLAVLGTGLGLYKVFKGSVDEKKDIEKRERSPYIIVVHPGDTVLRVDDTISWHTLDAENERVKRWGGAPATVREVKPGGYKYG